MTENRHSLYSSVRFNFLYVDIYSFTKAWSYTPSVLPYNMLRYILSGKAEFIVDDEQFVVSENQVVYLSEGSTLSCRALTDDFKFISVRFLTTVRLRDSDFLTEYFHIPRRMLCENTEVLGYFMEIYKNATSDNHGKMFRIRGNLELIIAFLAENSTAEKSAPEDTRPATDSADFSMEKLRARAQKTNIKRDSRVEMVVDYLVSHPTERIEMETLCKMANVSESSLRRLFKEQTGFPPTLFLKDLRVSTAARRLLVTNQRISDIAYELGYEDPNYFARIFKSIFGLSPQEYRKINHV